MSSDFNLALRNLTLTCYPNRRTDLSISKKGKLIELCSNLFHRKAKPAYDIKEWSLNVLEEACMKAELRLNDYVHLPIYLWKKNNASKARQVSLDAKKLLKELNCLPVKELNDQLKDIEKKTIAIDQTLHTINFFPKMKAQWKAWKMAFLFEQILRDLNPSKEDLQKERNANLPVYEGPINPREEDLQRNEEENLFVDEAHLHEEDLQMSEEENLSMNEKLFAKMEKERIEKYNEPDIYSILITYAQEFASKQIPNEEMYKFLTTISNQTDTIDLLRKIKIFIETKDEMTIKGLPKLTRALSFRGLIEQYTPIVSRGE